MCFWKKNRDILIIKQMLDNKSFDVIKMYEVLSHYHNNPTIIPCRINKGAKIIRSSTNSDNLFHDNVARLSYPPKEFARTDRASLKGKPAFYASVFTSAMKNNVYPRIISALETADILKDYQKTGIVFTTQSLWLPDRDLHLFAFPFSKKYKKPCEEIRIQRNGWNLLRKDVNEDSSKFFVYLGDLMAEENHSCLYDITATAIQYILTESPVAKKLDGIMYPSVWGEGQGMNICLKKETVDECVHFQMASVQCIEKTVGKSVIWCVAESFLLPDGSLKWTPTKEALHILEQRYEIKDMLNKGMLYFGNSD